MFVVEIKKSIFVQLNQSKMSAFVSSIREHLIKGDRNYLFSLSVLFTLLFFLQIAFAQSITFEKTFGGTQNEHGNCVRQTSDGGYIVLATGTGVPTLVSGVIQVRKTDSLGNQQWNKGFSGIGWAWARNLNITSDSGFIIVGSTSNFSTPTTHDVLLIKTDKSGNQQWFKNYDSLEEFPLFGSHEEGLDVLQTKDGGYILTGIAGSIGASNGKIIIINSSCYLFCC